MSEGHYLMSANAATFVSLGSLGHAPTAANGFCLGSTWPMQFSVGPNSGGVVAALAVTGVSLVSVTKRQ
ncbi:MAG: hypothetical protein IT371_14310 [Deltaproteobacteria bacterium]|nr:hypothetical protein [Deltaproteobacteria bacterium]